jgi:hypothetical protein
MVPIGERATCSIRYKIVAQPFLLHRAPKLRVSVAIQRYDVPRAEIVTIVTATGGPRLFAKVLEIRERFRRAIVVIPRRWPRALAVAAPSEAVTLDKLLRASVLINIVPCREDSPADFVEQPSLNISPKKQTKAALRGIKVVPTNSYARGEERPYGNTVYTRTDGISATGKARGGRAV